MKKELLIINIIVLCINLSYSQVDIWEQTNGPSGGNLRSLAFNKSGQLFAGGIGGIFKYTSQDGWTQTYGTQDFVTVLASNHDGQLFAGAWSDGFYRSLDFGKTWEQEYTNSSDRDYIKSIDINDNNYIFVSTQTKGIFRSTDLGESFTPVNNGLNTINIRACSFNSVGNVFAVTDSGVFKSVNNGEDWIGINEGLTDIDIQDISINSNDDIFIISRSKAFRSIDNGDNWIQLVLDESIMKFVLAINANGNIFVGAGSDWLNYGVFRSTDNGNTWNHLMQGLQQRSGVFQIIFDANDKLYANTTDNIYYSSTNGTSWNAMNEGLKATTTQAMLCSKNNYLIVANYDGLFRTGNRGDTWTQTSVNTDILGFTTDPRNGNIFAVGDWYKILKSTNDGATWSEINIIGSEKEGIAINSHGHIFVLAIGFGVIRSTDNGETWDQFESDLTNTRTTSIIIDKNDIIFVGTPWNGVFRSIDNGVSWSAVNNGFNYIDARDIEINDAGILYVAMYNGEIYRSDDKGDTWIQVGDRMWSNISDITIHPVGDIFAASFSYGVFRLDKNSGYWIRYNEGLGWWQTRVTRLSSDSSGYLYAGVVGNSIYRTIEPLITSVLINKPELPSVITLEQNYPNPFNPTTTINYSLPKTSFLTIRIYDVLGSEVAELVNEEKPAGRYEVEFDASQLSSGIYFYKLQAGDYVKTKKMVLLR